MDDSDNGLSLDKTGIACLQAVQYQYSPRWSMCCRSFLEQQGQFIDQAVVKRGE